MGRIELSRDFRPPEKLLGCSESEIHDAFFIVEQIVTELTSKEHNIGEVELMNKINGMDLSTVSKIIVAYKLGQFIGRNS